MDFETIESLRVILDYLYADEEKNWLEAGRPARDHIYHDIMRVAKWLDSSDNLPCN